MHCINHNLQQYDNECTALWDNYDRLVLTLPGVIQRATEQHVRETIPVHGLPPAARGAGHPCISFINNAYNGTALCYRGGPGADDQAAGALSGSITTITMPLCRIAARLGMTGVEPGHALPDGIWISDGSDNGKAYNYVELIDKMTDRMAQM
jgi:hypothetical protein